MSRQALPSMPSLPKNRTVPDKLTNDGWQIKMNKSTTRTKSAQFRRQYWNVAVHKSIHLFSTCYLTFDGFYFSWVSCFYNLVSDSNNSIGQMVSFLWTGGIKMCMIVRFSPRGSGQSNGLGAAGWMRLSLKWWTFNCEEINTIHHDKSNIFLCKVQLSSVCQSFWTLTAGLVFLGLTSFKEI